MPPAAVCLCIRIFSARNAILLAFFSCRRSRRLSLSNFLRARFSSSVSSFGRAELAVERIVTSSCDSIETFIYIYYFPQTSFTQRRFGAGGSAEDEITTPCLSTLIGRRLGMDGSPIAVG